MFSTTNEKSFIEEIVPSSFLEDAVEWISVNLHPEDVFDEGTLDEWALDNGYVLEED